MSVCTVYLYVYLCVCIHVMCVFVCVYMYMCVYCISGFYTGFVVSSRKQSIIGKHTAPRGSEGMLPLGIFKNLGPLSLHWWLVAI